MVALPEFDSVFVGLLPNILGCPAQQTESRRLVCVLGLHVEVADFGRVFGDELEPSRNVFAHQIADHLIGAQLFAVFHGNPQRLARFRIERSHLQCVGIHFAETLEPRDIGLGVGLGVLLE